MNINICEEYTDAPGGRYESQGRFSGEDFRKKILKPRFIEASNKNEKLFIDFDGGYGYGSSFLEEAFGGLIRELKEEHNLAYKKAFDIIEIKSEDEPGLIARVIEYMNDEIKN